MKKITCFVVCVSFLLPLTGCSNNVATDTANNNVVQAQERSGVSPPVNANHPAQNRGNSTTVISLTSWNPSNVEREEVVHAPVPIHRESWNPIFSPCGKKIMTRRGLTIEIWDAETRKVLHTWERGVSGSHSGAMFSPDGTKIIARTTVSPPRQGINSGNFLDEKDIIQIWDTETGKELMRLEGKFDSDSKFSPDGKSYLAILEHWTTQRIENASSRPYNRDASGNLLPLYLANTTFQLFDVESGKELHRWQGNFDRSYGASFTPCGTKIVIRRATYHRNSTTTQTEEHSLHFLNTATGEELTIPGGAYRNAPDGKRIIVRIANVRIESIPGETRSRWITEDGEITLWDIEAWKALHKWEGTFSRAYFSRDGKKIITNSETATIIWDAETLEEWKRLDRKKVNVTSFSQDAKRFVTNTDDATIIWDTKSKQELQTLEGLTGRIWSAVFSPDEKTIVTIGRDRRGVRIWSIESGQQLGAMGGGDSVWFSADGRFVLAGMGNWEGGNVSHIWDVEAGKEITREATQWEGRVPIFSNSYFGSGIGDGASMASFSPDKKRIVGLTRFGSQHGEILILDVATMEQHLAELETKHNAEEARRRTEQVERMRIAEERHLAEMEAIFAQAIDINEVLRQSGFSNVSDFAQFGSAERRRALQQGDALERARAAQEIDGVQAEIAQRFFFGMYEYTYDDSQVELDLSEDRSQFHVTVSMGFVGLDERRGAWIQGSDMFNLDVFDASSSEAEWEVFYKELRDFGFPEVSLHLPDREDIERFSRNVRMDALGIGFTIWGNIKTFERFAQDKDDYRVKVWFTNLQHANGVASADVLRIEIIEVQ